MIRMYAVRSEDSQGPMTYSDGQKMELIRLRGCHLNNNQLELEKTVLAALTTPLSAKNGMRGRTNRWKYVTLKEI